MDHPLIDRRVARTKAALEKALLALILQKDYHAISVEDICIEANVGRSTFYGHFTSKDDLKRSGLFHLRKLLIATPVELSGSNQTFSLKMFRHAQKHSDQFRALSRGGVADLALDVIREIVVDAAKVELVNNNGGGANSSVPLEVKVEFIVGAFMSVLVWWLRTGAPLSPEAIDQMFRQMIAKGLINES